MDTSCDSALENFKGKFGKSYGQGAIPWGEILAALAAMLTGCVGATAASVKTQLNRPLVQIRMRRRMIATGIEPCCVNRLIDATVRTGNELSDAEITGLIAAAQETE